MLLQFQSFLANKNTNFLSKISYQYYSKNNPLTFKNNSIPFISQRDILDSNNEKYAEKILFNSIGNKFAVAIGYNPAINSSTSIDKSNFLISNLLYNQNYSGYYLFNIFPDVSVLKINKNNSSYPNYIEDVLDFLFAQTIITNLDLIIFWGSSAYVNKNIEKKLKTLNTKFSTYTIGTNAIIHKHPGRNVCINTIKLNTNNLSSLTKKCRYLK